ncbi:MAG: tRNA (adenosine(37)-N6)-threonylcarbamoyltransferase complex transferase subunit TsaD [Campylobacterales bacterium]|nr:tRNA (adenosine(37)-N6)-threonylcarbamoyltransferase complex transferase subunit TsaD [Campylobacterales bacterium]
MILAIESSCDDSSVAVVEISTKKVVFHKKISQEKQHNEFGGVVPELAARLHATALPKIIEEAKTYFKDLKAIAVTNEPGLTVTLVEGVMAAKALSVALKIPLIPIHHLKGHIYSTFIEKDTLFPLSALIASGGHTQIVNANSYEDMIEIGGTTDDSIGESYDKVAKMLDLGYPGGPIVEEMAKKGNEKAYNFPVPMQKTKDIVFSYSGLKNSVRLEIEKAEELTDEIKADICASFQLKAVRHLEKKCEIFFEKYRPKNFAIVGGVSANQYLRSKIGKICENHGANLLLADLKYTSDNAVMIARAAIELYEQNKLKTIEDVDIKSRSPIKGKN